MSGPRDNPPLELHSGRKLAFGLVALTGEVLLFAALGQVLHTWGGGGWRGLLSAAVGLAVAVWLWAVFMAPTAARRRPVLQRLILCSVVGLTLGALLAGAGWPRFGVGAVIAGLAVAWSQWVIASPTSDRPSEGVS